MNIRYTITWPDPQDEQIARRFYHALRAGVARAYSKPGSGRFPFDSAYEVGLVRGPGEPPKWSVMALAVNVKADQAGGGADTLPALKDWLGQTVPGGLPPEASISAGPAAHLKLYSELGADYEVVDSFGTFVGEPALEDLPPEPPAPAGDAPQPETREADPEAAASAVAIEAAPPTPAGEAKPAASATAAAVPSLPAPTASTAPPRPAPSGGTGISKELSTCLRLFLIGTGILLLPASLMMAAIISIGQFGEPTDATVSAGEYIFLLLCCPAPLLLLGVGLIVFGAVLPKLVRGKS